VSGPGSANRSVREQFAPADEPWDRLGQGEHRQRLCPRHAKQAQAAHQGERLGASFRRLSARRDHGSAESERMVNLALWLIMFSSEAWIASFDA
jgi:hypothetical protein